MKKIELFITTASNKEVEVGIAINGKRDVVKRILDKNRAQIVLPLIMEVVSRHSLHLSDITAVEVERGPGSFTGLRVGVSIANTLGMYLRIPVNGQVVGEIVTPVYS